MPIMNRALLLRRLKARDGARYPAIDDLQLHVAMRRVFEVATTVGGRHFPRRENVREGKRCVFLEPVNRTGEAVLFHAYIYTAGHTPDQVVRDFDAAHAEISAEAIHNADDQPVEVVHRMTCAVLGDALVAENARIYGGMQLVVGALRDLIRRHQNPIFPALNIDIIPTREFIALAREHGGVESFTARVSADFTPEQDTLGHELAEMFRKRNLDRSKRISATIDAESGQELDPEEVLKLIDESEGGTGLSGVSVKFTDGTTMSDLDTYKERHVVEVQEVRSGVPAANEIVDAIVGYLRDLSRARDGNFQRIITPEGRFV